MSLGGRFLTSVAKGTLYCSRINAGVWKQPAESVTSEKGGQHERQGEDSSQTGGGMAARPPARLR